jgi:predicted nucleic acid-binding protein
LRKIFLDSFYFIALMNDDDSDHDSASVIALELDDDKSVRMVTTDAVLIEVLNFIRGRGGRSRAVASELVSELLRNRRYDVVRMSPALFDDALKLYVSRPDKSYSMVDCISMIVCRAQGIMDVVTGDADFRREGFNALFAKK